MNARAALLLGSLSLGLLGACNIYNSSLLGAGGGTGSATTATATATAGTGTSATTGGHGGGGTGGDTGEGGATTGTGGAKPCGKASDCPGQDTECKKRACNGGVCDFTFTGDGTALAAQAAKDCQKAVCDGAGATKSIPDDADLPVDGNECTDDACAQGLASNPPKPAGTACGAGMAQKCTADSKCVDCVVDGDCVSQVCDPATFKCAPSGCGDVKKNGGETDVDCGGAMCPPCATGQFCGAGTDCVGGSCVGGVCAPTCTDGKKNNAESDVDCGGMTCGACDIGQTCGVGGDCKTGSCVLLKCACANDHVVISEIRSRGVAGAVDEFIELYNPTGADVVLDATWLLESRSTAAGSYSKRWAGVGKTVASHAHYLIANTAYTQQPAKDDPYSGATGITDASSVRLTHGGALVDAVCYGYSASTKTTLMGVGYDCEGTPADNQPHNDASGVGNADVSIQRKPGGALGNCIDSGDNSADFMSTMPSLPQSTASPTTP